MFLTGGGRQFDILISFNDAYEGVGGEGEGWGGVGGGAEEGGRRERGGGAFEKMTILPRGGQCA